MRLINNIVAKLDLDKPTALTLGEWRRWHDETKSVRPIAYFIMETIPTTAGRTYKRIMRPFSNARAWVRYRTFDRRHMIDTGLPPGYHDCDSRMLHGVFNLLVEFVEIELALRHVIFDPDADKKYPRRWWNKGPLRFKAFRSPAAGLAYLRWEMTLDDPKLPAYDQSPHQAEVAREIWQIYHWWKFIRPKRPDPHDASGWSEFCKNHTFDQILGDDLSDEARSSSKEILDSARDIEQAYEDEDEAMIARLMKIRKSLWT